MEIGPKTVLRSKPKRPDETFLAQMTQDVLFQTKLMLKVGQNGQERTWNQFNSKETIV
jgi:hypothetical protein